jgi:sulfur-carrier protein
LVRLFKFGSWCFGFTWDLAFGIWDFGAAGIGDFAAAMIRVILPHHLRTLARVGEEVEVELNSSPTIRSVLDALEAKYPMLQGTIRDHGTLKRRPMVRFFLCGQDLSLESPDTPLPEAIVNGTEPFFVMGAIAGG